LEVVEGTTIDESVQNSRFLFHHDKKIELDTKEMLFIFSGSFQGIENIIQKRCLCSSSDNLDKIISEDFCEYGLIPELIARIPIIFKLNNLSEHELYTILMNTNNTILEEYKNLFKIENIQLNFTEKGIRSIVRYAFNRKAGFRGIKELLDRLTIYISNSLILNQKENKIDITEDLIKNISD